MAAERSSDTMMKLKRLLALEFRLITGISSNVKTDTMPTKFKFCHSDHVQQNHL